MKRKLLFITAIWLISLIFTTLLASKGTYSIDDSYKITINRIQYRLTDDLQKNIQIINALKKEEMHSVDKIEILDYQHKTNQEFNSFFEAGDIHNDKVVFKPIEGTDYIVKYSIVNNAPSNNPEIIWYALIVTGAYLIFMIHVFMLNKNVIKPMERSSVITKQLARGYLGEVNLQYKNKNFKDFIWGLDMLREQLAYEREKMQS